MKLTAITATAALLAFPAFAEQSIVYPQCELVDMGGYYNLAPAGCSRVSQSNERDDHTTVAEALTAANVAQRLLSSD